MSGRGSPHNNAWRHHMNISLPETINAETFGRLLKLYTECSEREHQAILMIVPYLHSPKHCVYRRTSILPIKSILCRWEKAGLNHDPMIRPYYDLLNWWVDTFKDRTAKETITKQNSGGER
jgi:hypothetical protein